MLYTLISPLVLAIAAMIVGISLAAASACDPSHGRAVAKNCARAEPAVVVLEPRFEGKSPSDPGSNQTGRVSITDSRVYSTDAKVQLKIAVSEREVLRTG
jgi:hypothetical protein